MLSVTQFSPHLNGITGPTHVDTMCSCRHQGALRGTATSLKGTLLKHNFAVLGDLAKCQVSPCPSSDSVSYSPKASAALAPGMPGSFRPVYCTDPTTFGVLTRDAMMLLQWVVPRLLFFLRLQLPNDLWPGLRGGLGSTKERDTDSRSRKEVGAGREIRASGYKSLELSGQYGVGDYTQNKTFSRGGSGSACSRDCLSEQETSNTGTKGRELP